MKTKKVLILICQILGSLVLFSAWLIEHNTLQEYNSKIRHLEYVKNNADEKVRGYESYHQTYGILYSTVVNNPADTMARRIAGDLYYGSFVYRNALRQDLDELLNFDKDSYSDEWKRMDLTKMGTAENLMKESRKKGIADFAKLVPEYIYSIDSATKVFTWANGYRNKLYSKSEDFDRQFKFAYVLGSAMLALAFIISKLSHEKRT